MRLIIVALTTASAVAYLAPSRANHKRSYTGLIAISSGLSDEPPVKEEKELSGEDMDKIERDIRDNAPSELEVRLNLLGVTPWTVAGFILAGVIITLNNVLGYGWASELLGLDSTVPLQITSEGRGGEPRAEGQISGNVLKLDDKLREARDELTPIEIDDM